MESLLEGENVISVSPQEEQSNLSPPLSNGTTHARVMPKRRRRSIGSRGQMRNPRPRVSAVAGTATALPQAAANSHTPNHNNTSPTPITTTQLKDQLKYWKKKHNKVVMMYKQKEGDMEKEMERLRQQVVAAEDEKKSHLKSKWADKKAANIEADAKMDEALLLIDEAKLKIADAHAKIVATEKKCSTTIHAERIFCQNKIDVMKKERDKAVRRERMDTQCKDGAIAKAKAAEANAKRLQEETVAKAKAAAASANSDNKRLQEESTQLKKQLKQMKK